MLYSFVEITLMFMCLCTDLCSISACSQEVGAGSSIIYSNNLKNRKFSMKAPQILARSKIGSDAAYRDAAYRDATYCDAAYRDVTYCDAAPCLNNRGDAARLKSGAAGEKKTDSSSCLSISAENKCKPRKYENVISFGCPLACVHGMAKELNDAYGVVVVYRGYFIPPIDPMLYFFIQPSVGVWRSCSSPSNTLLTIALSIEFQAFFFPKETHEGINPYLEAGVGPVYLQPKHFGSRKQGSNVALQTTFGVGINVCRRLDFMVGIFHYCNAGFARPNQGFTMSVIMIGYHFCL